jgi:cytochrome c
MRVRLRRSAGPFRAALFAIGGAPIAAGAAIGRAALPSAFAVLAAAPALAEDEPGRLLYNNVCRTCHTMREGDNRLGPSLHGVVGRKAGSLPGFPFSQAMMSSGIVWDEAMLDRFIENPDVVVPGNGMKPYGGVVSPEKRALLVAHLKRFGR